MLTLRSTEEVVLCGRHTQHTGGMATSSVGAGEEPAAGLAWVSSLCLQWSLAAERRNQTVWATRQGTPLIYSPLLLLFHRHILSWDADIEWVKCESDAQNSLHCHLNPQYVLNIAEAVASQKLDWLILSPSSSLPTFLHLLLHSLSHSSSFFEPSLHHSLPSSPRFSFLLLPFLSLPLSLSSLPPSLPSLSLSSFFPPSSFYQALCYLQYHKLWIKFFHTVSNLKHWKLFLRITLTAMLSPMALLQREYL